MEEQDDNFIDSLMADEAPPLTNLQYDTSLYRQTQILGDLTDIKPGHYRQEKMQTKIHAKTKMHRYRWKQEN